MSDGFAEAFAATSMQESFNPTVQMSKLGKGVGSINWVNKTIHFILNINLFHVKHGKEFWYICTSLGKY